MMIIINYDNFDNNNNKLPQPVFHFVSIYLIGFAKLNRIIFPVIVSKL